MSKFAEDTIAVIDIHGCLYCANCYDSRHFPEEVKELKRVDLEKMTHSKDPGHAIHFHLEECDECERVWGTPTGKTAPRWVYRHQLEPMTEEEKKTSHGFFIDGGLNGEYYVIPYHHAQEWFIWINAQDGPHPVEAPDYCTCVELTNVVFDTYKIDTNND